MTSSRRASDSTPGVHLATLAYEGLIWEAYLDFENDPRHPRTHRAKIRFEPPSAEEGGPPVAETTIIIIEDSYEEAVYKARRFDNRQLQGMLRSALPDPIEDE
ncbi:MAG: hypothetical protein R3304_01050 [Longimicrobiales bacterium]|nr:hypothetical protein [Longimicrobiales bacterium]